jgi:2-oxoglutarate dehydrogenase E2 component (dihydrolipoamide succinyltransferase)
MTDVIMPQMGESIAEGTVTKWHKKVGERVERDEPLFEISTDKVDTEIPSPVSGILTEIRVSEGQTVPINTVVAVIGGPAPDAAADPARRTPQPAAAEAAPPPTPVQPPSRPSAPAATGRGPRSSPLVRKMAREHRIDLPSITGSGEGGRITKQDVLRHLEARQGSEPPAPPASSPVPSPVAPATSATTPSAPRGRVEIVPMTAMRKSIAEHMVASRRTSAHVTTVFEADVSRIVQVRESLKDTFENDEGVKLTYTPFFVRAVTGALKAAPSLNASIEGDKILYHKDYNIGIAVALEGGLIVPVVQHADEKSFLGLARAVADLAERARAKKLKAEEVQGGTFTVTNPGPYGSLFGTPIINQPQVAILGVGGIHKRPVVVNDAIAVRSMVYLALSFDHRLVDGAVADQFMADVKRRLESWDEKIL